jgi:hypothetical protein
MSLSADIEQFLHEPTDYVALFRLIDACLEQGGAQGLANLRRLAEDVGYEIQRPAATCLLLFGEAGLNELAGIALAYPLSTKASHSLEAFPSIASGSALSPLSFVTSKDMAARLDGYLLQHPDLRGVAQRLLVQVLLAYKTDDDVATDVGRALTNLSMSEKPAARALFTATSARWIAVSDPVLAQYDALLSDHPNDESAFQAFFTAHPHLLDPLALEVWPQPRLYGYRTPDFIIRRADDSYLVIEIECPGKKLMTAASQATSHVTHAISQITEYDRYLMTKFSEMEKHFTSWDHPDLLVVCGIEELLNNGQRVALRNLNRGNRPQVVGFDWFTKRARAVTANILNGAVCLQENFRLI